MRFFICLVLTTASCLCNAQLVNKIEQRADSVWKKKKQSMLGGFFASDVKDVKRILSLHASANSNGYGGGFKIIKLKNKQLTHSLDIYVWEVKHDKEERLKPNGAAIEGYRKPSPYVLGKVNSLYNVGCFYTKYISLLEGIVPPSMNLSFVFGGGIQIGGLKPYYIQLKQSTNQSVEVRDVHYTPSLHDTFLNSAYIYSRSAYEVGANDTKILFGASAFAGLNIELGPNHVFYKALEFGCRLNGYSHKIQLMVGERSKMLFPQWYMGITLGKGW